MGKTILRRKNRCISCPLTRRIAIYHNFYNIANIAFYCCRTAIYWCSCCTWCSDKMNKNNRGDNTNPSPPLLPSTPPKKPNLYWTPLRTTVQYSIHLNHRCRSLKHRQLHNELWNWSLWAECDNFLANRLNSVKRRHTPKVTVPNPTCIRSTNIYVVWKKKKKERTTKKK